MVANGGFALNAVGSERSRIMVRLHEAWLFMFVAWILFQEVMKALIGWQKLGYCTHVVDMDTTSTSAVRFNQ